uniref:Expressed protein n=1 Tax=Oryza sativa subsp. japonica TaxID=39947 RepID=Q7XBU1_ORYSJ|nr:expressed protein [Oryza sativa Japonica Group]
MYSQKSAPKCTIKKLSIKPFTERTASNETSDTDSSHEPKSDWLDTVRGTATSIYSCTARN